jgi:hypothetical protein
MRTLYFARLDEQLRLAPAVSVNLLQQVTEACPRLPSHSNPNKRRTLIALLRHAPGPTLLSDWFGSNCRLGRLDA